MAYERYEELSSLILPLLTFLLTLCIFRPNLSIVTKNIIPGVLVTLQPELFSTEKFPAKVTQATLHAIASAYMPN